MLPPMLTPQMPAISAADFIARWGQTEFGERQAAQPFFDDICRLVGHPTTTERQDRDNFTFEKPVPGGFADAYLRNHFGWEFKGADAQLPGAFDQLLRYQIHLMTPPLLVVSSFQTIRIRTNFPGMETVEHEISVPQIGAADNLALLRAVFFNPEELKPRRTIAEVTQDTAKLFHQIVVDMETRTADRERLARFLNRIVFCLFAEDAGLLPDQLFTRLVSAHHRSPANFNATVANLFAEMADGGFFGADEIAPFNGDLFRDNDAVELTATALERLGEAAGRNWRNIEPSIFGTLFERAINASQRAQLGAHYTSSDDIMLVVAPVVMRPLRREWDAARIAAEELIDAGDREGAYAGLQAFRRRLAETVVLDPACGSGNFLYTTLKAFLDLEKEVILFLAGHDWDGETPQVGPRQMLGLEINHYAAELARTALWIGYIQWHQNNGFPYRRRPILASLDTIRQTDAILDRSDAVNPVEPEWPAAEFIIGNPPFLGHLPFRESLGDEYVQGIYGLYGDRIPNSSDLCCYWLEKARAQIETGQTRRAGLLATQAIRFQSNRPVLQRIKASGDIFAAISDRDWILDGAHVHISIICFDDGGETDKTLDDRDVANINADLTAGADLTQARRLAANRNLSFQGIGKVGDFDIPEEVALNMMAQPNPHGRPNREVIKRWVNGTDITRRPRNMWVIDFGTEMSEMEAALYEAPFEYVQEKVRPERVKNKMAWRAQNWWRHGYPAATMRQELAPLSRYIGTPKVAKHRFFVWLDSDVLPSNLVIAIASDDDYMLGVLQSRIHTTWASAMGSQLRESDSGGTYIPTSCFETFPFPEPTEEQRAAIASAAAELHRLRENWLNPVADDGSPALSAGELKRRTLTNLYNRRPAWLQNAHAALDAAAAAAYGWPDNLGDDAILERLLTLNRQRAAAAAAP